MQGRSTTHGREINNHTCARVYYECIQGCTKSSNGEMRNEKMETRKWKRKWKWSSFKQIGDLLECQSHHLVHSEGIIKSYDREDSLVSCPTLPLLIATIVPNLFVEKANL